MVKEENTAATTIRYVLKVRVSTEGTIRVVRGEFLPY